MWKILDESMKGNNIPISELVEVVKEIIEISRAQWKMDDDIEEEIRRLLKLNKGECHS